MTLSTPITDQERQNRNALLIAILSAIASGAAAVVQFIMAAQGRDWRPLLGGTVGIVAMVAFLLAIIPIRHKRPVQGMWIVLIAAEIELLVLNFLVSGLGLVTGIGIMILAIFAAVAAMPPDRIDGAGASGLAAGLLIVLADIFGLPSRTILQQERIIFAWSLMGSLIVIYSIVLSRRFRDISLQTRLTLLTILIILPLLVSIIAIVNVTASRSFEEQANQNLQQSNDALTRTVTTWYDLHTRALTQLVLLPDITSMNPALQKPVLVAMTTAYPEMFLVHTVDMNGTNIARSDDQAPKEYGDRLWFQQAASGVPVATQVLISRTVNLPALSIAGPIRNSRNEVVGVVGLTTTLESISSQIINVSIGESGYAYLIDETNRVIAHPNPAYTEQELFDLSDYPPVISLRQGNTGLITFTDENGIAWRAYVETMPNNWGVIVQQPEAELLTPQRAFQRTLVGTIGVGVSIVMMAVWFTLRRALNPIRELNNTVAAISAGDLERAVKIRGMDEIGTLGTAFNQMTSQLRDLISNLEQRVAERTNELGAANEHNRRRAAQFEAIAQVAHNIASVQEMGTVLHNVAKLISDRFGFYHVGIFLLDDAREYAVLSAANSAGGQRMLARGHRLKIGETGIVGNVAASGVARIALDVGEDAVFFQNPDLPETRSEIALPLHLQKEIVGVLDVQSTEAGAFSEEDVAVFETLSDQISVALQNARLFQESEKLLAEAQKSAGSYLLESWQEMQINKPNIGYRLSGNNIRAIEKPLDTPQIKQALAEGTTVAANEGKKGKSAVLAVPIRLRGKVIGVMDVRVPGLDAWDPDNVDIAEAVAERLSLAIENATLLEDSQRRAATERAIGEITSKISGSVNLRNVLRSTVQELGRILPGSEVIIQFQSDQEKKS